MYRIGIDVGGTNLKAGIVNEEFEIVYRKKVPLGKFAGADRFTRQLYELASDTAAEAGIGKEEISGVGMGFPGIVDDKAGEIVHITNIPLDRVPLRKLFQAYWNVPVSLGNDANCAALGEYYAGAGKDDRSLVVVTLGTGVGGGIVLGGRVVEGFNGTGGEVGHMVIVPGGEQCNCGRRGCWERYASANALKRSAVSAMQRHPESRMWRLVNGDIAKVEGYTPFDAAREGDAVAKEVCEKYIEYVALGAANLINILEPEVLAFGGGVCAQPDLIEPLRRRIREESFGCGTGIGMTRVEVCTLGNAAGIIGAAMLGE